MSSVDLLKSFFIFLLWMFLSFGSTQAQTCDFYENQQSVYTIDETIQPGVTIFRFSVRTAAARIDLQPDIVGPLVARYRWRFLYYREPTGNDTFALTANDTLILPSYPSEFTQTSLQFNVKCNNAAYTVGTVHIRNVNNFSPEFYRLPYSINISEATRPDSSFDLPILAIDWDPAAVYTLSFAIISGNVNNTFTLMESGNIRDISSVSELADSGLAQFAKPVQLPKLLKLVLNRPLDFDYGERIYRLVIQASDNGGSDNLQPRTNVTTLIVNIEDYDDRPPSFFRGSYRGNISASALPGTEVIFDEKIRAVDGDPALQAPIFYSLVPDTWTEYFGINDSTGAIFLAKKFPEDLSQSSFDLVLKASELSINHRWANAYIHINVVFSGKNVPVFAQCSYEASVRENTVLGAQVLQLSATDPDKGEYGRFFFYLLNTTDAQAFQIEENTGVISVAAPELMNREKQSSFQFQAGLIPFLESDRAPRDVSESPVDPDKCTEASILVTLIDENDSSPKFTNSSYVFTIVDTVTKNTEIGFVRATDADEGSNGEVIYGDIEQDARDFDEHVRFEGFPKPDGSLGIVIKFDAVQRPKFLPEYRLTVQAKDSGNPPRTSRARVEVRVVFSNSHVPVFEQAEYKKILPENTPFGTRILQVKATDPDEGDSGRFLYALKGDGGGAFRIDPSNGWISVANSSILDRETAELFQFKVIAEPIVAIANGTDVIPLGPTEASVVIELEDENDNAPAFLGIVPNITDRNEYHFFIQNTLQKDEYIGRVEAKDLDGSGDFGRVVLNPVSVPRFFSFAADGSISLKDQLPENPESDYTLVVEAHDSSVDIEEQKRTVATVKIFVKQTSRPAPRFTNLPNSIVVSEAMAVTGVVFIVTVTGNDRDATSRLKFDIKSGNTNDSFGMRNDVLFIKRRLDAEKIQKFILVISVTDGEQEAESNLEIDVQDSNDNPPLFGATLFNFDMSNRNMERGTVIGTVAATDADLTDPNNLIRYSLDRNAQEFFAIDETSGRLTVRSELPSGLQQYSFSVSAIDQGEPPLQAVAFITVQLTASSSRPKFTQVQYALDVLENDPPKPILVVLARHPTQRPSYTLSQNADASIFAINSADGTIETLKPLDYETKSEYQFTVSACIVNNVTVEERVSLCDESSVIVRVKDANDHSPVFRKPVYYVQIPNDTLIGTDVERVEATDQDSGALGDVSYALITATGYFSIDYSTGIIQTAAPLQTAVHNLTVEAFDHGKPSRKTTAHVVINVNGSNPHAPQFEQFTYRVSLPENVTAGTRILTLRAYDPDPGLDGSVFYRFSNDSQTKEQSGNFSLNATTGELFTNSELDYEIRSEYRLVVEAVDQSPMYPRSSATVVQIDVQDVNDHTPVFQPLPNRMYISMTKPMGSVILDVHASDADGSEKNSKILYSVTPEDGFFTMKENQLTVERRLVAGNYQLDIRASDTADPPRVASHRLNIVVRTDREKYPVFNELSYSLTLLRNATLPQAVHRFSAAVQSGGVEYVFLRRENPLPGLKLDSNSGDLVAEAEMLKYVAMNEPLFFVVRAINTADKAYFSDVVVKLTVRDDSVANIPLVFPSALFRGTVSENMPAGTKLNLTVEVVEPELFRSKLRYWLEPNDTFRIDSTGNIFTLRPIDLEGMAEESGGIYFLKIFASNGTSLTTAKLEIRVDDVDEYSPVFEKEIYEVQLLEDVTPGSQIVMVTAKDQDFTDRNNLKFAISGGDAAEYAVVQDFGLVVKSDSPLFDRENASRMFLKVSATDRAGNLAETNINLEVMDVNDNKPRFVGIPYVWNITEGPAGLDQKFTVSAADADLDQNGNVSFKIFQGNSQRLFLLKNVGINRAEISVIRELDRESKASRMLTIEARDNGDPSLFDHAIIDISVIDVNDNPPRFYQRSYEKDVPSSFPADFTILTVYAVDKDLHSDLRYYIMEDPTGDLFKLDPVQGLLKFTRKPPRTTATYSLRLNVTDGRFFDFANATIRVYVSGGGNNETGDGNELPPVFGQTEYNFTVVEGEENARVGIVSAHDPDSDLRVVLKISPKEYNELFEFQEQGSVLKTRKALPYLKNQPFYSFVVTATDLGSPRLSSFAQVRVNIRDINNNVPKFSRNDYSALIPANARRGFPVQLSIEATDGDAGLNAKIRYSLSGPDAKCFSVDVHVPQLTLQCDPDFYVKKIYSLTIRATDRDGDGNSSTAQLKILVSPPIDVTTPQPENETSDTTTTARSTTTRPECKIEFPKSIEEILLTEATPVMAPVFHVRPNVSGDCTVSYELKGPADQYFSIDSVSGTVVLRKTLKIEELRKEGLFDPELAGNALSFNVTVFVDGMTAQTLVLVFRIVQRKVGSVLVFDFLVYRFWLKEEEPEGTVVGTVIARNLNATNNRTQILYSVLFGENLFEIGNSSVGDIVSRQKLDSDGTNPKEYSFVVQAMQGNMNDYAAVIVNMKDINDNPPEFSKPSYAISIPEGPYGAGGSVIADISASDPDSGVNALVSYSINSSDLMLPFRIDPNNGKLRIFGTVDRELTSSYFFHLVATDGGSPPLSSSVPVNVTISDVNDNAPVFKVKTLAVSVREKGPPKEFVARVFATDPDEGDNGRVHYVLTNFQDDFTVDSELGKIETLRPLDYSKQNQYFLQIQASDFGKPRLVAVANVTVEVVEDGQSRPHFSKDMYFAEPEGDTSPGETFLALTAGVGPLSYSLSGDEENLFSLTEDTGQLSFGNVPGLDQRNQRYKLTVTATNETSGEADSTVVMVYVLGTGDGRAFERTQYYVEMRENNKPNSLIIDLNSIYELRNLPVRYSLPTHLTGFAINETTGELYATVSLDRDKRSFYPIRVKATSPSRKRGALDIFNVANDETLVLLNVTDENDNAPQFITASGGPSVLTVLKDQKIGQRIGFIRAEDPDEGSQIRFQMNSGKDSDKFRLIPESGAVLAAVDFSTTDKDQFEFSVTAFDNGNTHQTNGVVMVYKLTETNQAILVSELPRKKVEKYLRDLQRELRQLTGWNVTITHVTQHTENGMIYLNKSDIWVYANDPATHKPVTGETLMKTLNRVLPKLKERFKELRLKEVKEPPQSGALSQIISPAELALIVISCLIILTALLACCMIFKWWKRREKDKVSSEYMIDSTSSGPRPYDTETLDRKTAASILSTQRGFFAHPPRPVVSSTDRPPMAIPYDYEEDSSGGSNGSVLSRRFLYYGDYHTYAGPRTASTTSS